MKDGRYCLAEVRPNLTRCGLPSKAAQLAARRPRDVRKMTADLLQANVRLHSAGTLTRPQLS
jgi:hypothetical protein